MLTGRGREREAGWTTGSEALPDLQGGWPWASQMLALLEHKVFPSPLFPHQHRLDVEPRPAPGEDGIMNHRKYTLRTLSVDTETLPKGLICTRYFRHVISCHPDNDPTLLWAQKG